MASLSKVSIGVKTFLRDLHLFHVVEGIIGNMLETRMIIVDDGEVTDDRKTRLYEVLRSAGHEARWMPFDSGFGAKSNLIASILDRDFLLMASDDFDFHPKQVRQGIEKMVEVLENYPEVDIASGRVNNRPYEFDLIDEGDVITEIPVDTTPIRMPDSELVYPEFIECDLTVNYSLIRKRVFEKVRWDNDVKIGGGEHGSWFLDCKRAGFKTAYVPGANINTQTLANGERYNTFRRRANSPERPCFDKRGIKKYILGSGYVDYERKA